MNIIPETRGIVMRLFMRDVAALVAIGAFMSVFLVVTAGLRGVV